MIFFIIFFKIRWKKWQYLQIDYDITRESPRFQSWDESVFLSLHIFSIFAIINAISTSRQKFCVETESKIDLYGLFRFA